MSIQKYISVLIVDQSLSPVGVLANTCFVLGLTAGRLMPVTAFGHDTVDGDGSAHRYLTSIAHFVRKAGQSKIRTLRATLIANPEVSLVGYTEDAAPSDYKEYAENLVRHSGDQIVYRALHVYGPEEVVTPLTKNLSRL